MQTLFGISNKIGESSVTIVWAIALPLITFLIPLLVSSIFVAIIIPTAINVVVNTIIGLVKKEDGISIAQIALRNFILGIYSILWTHHIFILSQNHNS